MAGDINVMLQASVTVFGFDATVDLTLAGAPFTISLSAGRPVELSQLWGDLSSALQSIVGFGLPDLFAWSAIAGAKSAVTPSLWIGPSGSDPNKMSVYLSLDLVEPINIGGEIDIGGGVTVSITPNFSVWSLYLGYDAAAGGLDLRARVTTPTTTASGGAGTPKSQIVSYPFPTPAQGSAGGLQVHYLGLGQHVGPTTSSTLEAIFDQLENELKGDDPRSVVTTLARNFYQPDRNWFIAADLELKGFRFRVLFNDPSMYGFEITVAANAVSPFAGLLFEILYQKLGPNLGLYYGALTLPTLMRRIPLEGFILILPGFAIWVYTNGDFRINVGWPLGDNSIGISFDILLGRAGFYFAKLRSSDNPGAQPNADYNPILAFGMAVSLSAYFGFNASIFSASISIALTASFQGLLAWRAGQSISRPPDHYWFAATASVSVLIQGAVDFAIIRASVTISFVANVGVAFETGCKTLIEVSAEVEVDIGIKVIFFTIHLSFHTSVSSQFTIGSGPLASINGPTAPGLDIIGGFGALSEVQLRALEFAERAIARRGPAHLRARAQGRPFAPAADAPPVGAPLREGGPTVPPALAEPPALIELSFVLQPTATYGSPSSFALIASLLTDCPGPPGSPQSPGETSFERLIRALVGWLLGYAAGSALSDRFAILSAALGHGADAPFGDWTLFESRLRAFLQSECVFTLTGVDEGEKRADDVAAAVLPMFDVLSLTTPNGDTIDFDSYDPAGPDYPLAIEYYYQALAGPTPVGAPAPGARRAQALRAAMTAAGSPAQRSVASYLFLDYFLMQARNAVNALLPAAVAYENSHKKSLTDAVGRTGADGLAVAELVTEFVDRVTGAQELDDLLAAFDYASAAGIGSRFLLGGLQLPVPADVRPHPTPHNMIGVPTAPLFALSGQQSAVARGVAVATLAVNPHSTLPPLPITFAGSPPGAGASASFDLPAVLPPMPAPAWGGASPVALGAGDLAFAWLPPVTPQPMYLALKSHTGWARPSGPAALLPLPEPLQTLLSSRNGLALSISASAPPQGPGTAASPPGPPIPSAPALQIRLTLSQAPASDPGAVSQSGSPTPGSPSANAATRQYLPHIYQIGGTDEPTRDLIQAALQGDLSQARIALLYPWTEPGSPQHGGSPAASIAVLRSDALNPDVLIAKTNLSTLNQIADVGRMFAMQAAATSATATDLAAYTDVPGFLRLIWELSVVNAPGYFLFYATEDGADLPAELFASAGAKGGQTLEFDVVVEFAPAGDVAALPAYANAVVVDGAPGAMTGGPLYAEVLASPEGPPVLSYSPTYPAGSIAFAIAWNRPEDDSPVPVGELYHLLQYNVRADATYEGSVWSLPIGPGRNALPQALSPAGAGHHDHYVQPVPASNLLRQPSGPVNRYGVIGNPVTIDLRIVDIYGNALPDSHTSAETPLYQDPLIALGEWPGLFVSYGFAADLGHKARLSIALHFDPDAVLPPNGSPGSGIPRDRARAAWLSTLDRYALILDQVSDPNVEIEAFCSLLGGAAAGGQAQATVVATARAIVEAIETALATAHSPDEPVVASVYETIAIAVPFAAVQALSEVVAPLTVSVAFSRAPQLVDSRARDAIPAVSRVAFDVSPDLSGGGSPGGSSALLSFAEPFEKAFQDFDGAGGCLKLAERAGVSTGASPSASPSLWVLRWSGAHGVNVALGDALAFFALTPLSTTPVSRAVDGQTWNGVDMDAWARDFLSAFDAFLTPEMAVAIGVLDLREGASGFDLLTRTKQRLAATIKLGLQPLFVDQGDRGDLTAARERFEQAMLVSVASAYTVSTVIQIPAEVTISGSVLPESPGVAPRLYGAIGSPQASPEVGRASPYSLSSGNLELAPGGGWMTTLLTVAQANRQAELVLPLQYQVSYLQHDFEPQEGYLGYIPSSWLKFALPDAPPLQMPIATAAALPIPLTFLPTPPVLTVQSATAAALGSPASPQTAAQEIAESMRWVYSAELGLALAAQDALYVDVTYNRSASLSAARAFELDPTLGLFDALARFRSWYAAYSGAFREIPAAAFSNLAAGAPALSPGAATELIHEFQAKASAVADAWEALYVGRARAMAGLEETLDHFYLVTESGPPFTITLFGRNDFGGPPGNWPTLVTADGQSWTPNAATVVQASPGGWFETSHSFAQAPDLATLTLESGPLDILTLQSAVLSAKIVRNADLLPGRETVGAFIYRTQEASFAASIIPLIHRGALPPLTPGASLYETLTEILTPIEQVGVGLALTLQLSAAYSYSVTPLAPALMSETAVALVKDAVVTSPQDLARSAATTIADWFLDVNPSTLNGVLSLAITLFGAQGEVSLPLVQFDQILIPTGGLPDAWWSGGLE